MNNNIKSVLDVVIELKYILTKKQKRNTLLVFAVKRLAVAKTVAAKYVTLLVLILFIEKNPPIYIYLTF